MASTSTCLGLRTNVGCLSSEIAKQSCSSGADRSSLSWGIPGPSRAQPGRCLRVSAKKEPEHERKYTANGASELHRLTTGAAISLGSLLASSLPSEAAELSSSLAFADGGAAASPLAFALAGGGAMAVLAAALSFTDPEKRRQQQAAEVGGNEKDVVKNYFDTTGFERWKRIYGETDDVNTVQMDIRVGHAQTVEKVINWLKDRSLEGVTICDAGCGTGSLTIPLALEGAKVSASDISSSMVSEAAQRAEAAIKEKGKGVAPVFEARDLESISGKYDVVACLDVFIHYPQDKADEMVKHLASLAEKRLIISFAPKTGFYSVLKRIGELFPGPSKATRAYLHAEDDVEAALKAAGWRVVRKEMTATRFYFSRLFEAVPI